MSMVESGLVVSILPELILRRVPYHIVIKELDVPAYRTIALSIRDRQTASLAVKRFVDYLDYRNSVSPSLLKKTQPTAQTSTNWRIAPSSTTMCRLPAAR